MAKRRRVPTERGAGSVAPAPRVGPSFDRSWYRRALVWLVAAKIAGIVLIVDTASVQSFDLPKTLYSHATAWLIAGLLIAALVRFGLGIVPRSPLHWAVGAVLLSYALSSALAENHYVALFGEWKRYLGFAFAVDMAVLYLAVAVAFRTIRDWAIFGVGTGAAVLFTLIYALAQWLGLDPVPWADSPRLRPFGTTGNADIYGQLLSLALGAGVGVAVFVQRRAWRISAAVLTLALLAMSAIVATRGSALGLAAGVLGAVGCAAVLRGGRAVPLRLIGVAAGLGIVATGGLLVLTPLGARIRETGSGNAQVLDRLVIYKSAFEAFLARPVFGWGPDGLATAYPRFSQPESLGVLGINSLLSSAHDWVLQTAVTLGIVGLVAQVALYALATWLLVRALRTERRVAGPLLVALAADLAHGLVSVGSISVDWLPWLACGGAVALTAGTGVVSQRRRPETIAEAFAIGLACIALLFGQGALQASHDALDARAAIARKDASRAVAASGSAIARDGGRAEYWKLLGQAYDLEQAWKQAGDAYDQAGVRQPYDPTTWESLAVSRTKQAFAGDRSSGGQDAALAAARRGAELDRYNAAGWIVQAQVANAFKQWDLGMRSSAMALHLSRTDKNFRNDIHFQQILVDAAYETTDLPTARRLMEDLVAENDTPILRGAIAKIALKQNDREGAIVNAKRALELDPTNADAKQVLAATAG